MRQGLPQGRQARGLGIVGVALGQRPPPGFHNRLGGAEVGRTRRQVNNVATGRRQFRGPVQDLDDPEGLDVSDPVRKTQTALCVFHQYPRQ